MTADDGASALAANDPFVGIVDLCVSERLATCRDGAATLHVADRWSASSSERVGEFVQRLADRGVVAILDVLRERDARQALLAMLRPSETRPRRDEPPLPRRSLPLV